jgi:hypothetical protein
MLFREKVPGLRVLMCTELRVCVCLSGMSLVGYPWSVFDILINHWMWDFSETPQFGAGVSRRIQSAATPQLRYGLARYSLDRILGQVECDALLATHPSIVVHTRFRIMSNITATTYTSRGAK